MKVIECFGDSHPNRLTFFVSGKTGGVGDPAPGGSSRSQATHSAVPHHEEAARDGPAAPQHVRTRVQRQQRRRRQTSRRRIQAVESFRPLVSCQGLFSINESVSQ